MDLRTRIHAQRDAILEICARHGARNVRLFGSVARGEADEQSDVDVLVDMDPDRSLLDHAALMLDLQDLLGCRVDVATEKALKPRIRDRVMKEAVPV